MSNRGNSDNNSTSRREHRLWLAIVVLAVSIAGVAALAAIVLLRSEELETAKYVFAVVLPFLVRG